MMSVRLPYGISYFEKLVTENYYAVLYLEFSRIDTSSIESTFEDFLSNVRWGVKSFLDRYTQWDEKEKQA